MTPQQAEFTADDFAALPLRDNFRLCDLTKVPATWGRPQFKAEIGSYDGFSPGYMKMIRFYAVTLWEALALLGYGWVMRFDDDSRLVSGVAYNLFDRMRAEHKASGGHTT